MQRRRGSKPPRIDHGPVASLSHAHARCLGDVVKPAADILERARSDFAKDDLARAVELLGTYSGPEKARVLRCALHLSGGTLERLEYFMHAAQVD